jgi:DNA-binding response OmpR family regulator
LLRHEGNGVLVAKHGIDALRILEQQPVDLLITDLKMPVFDGRALARRVWARWPAMPIVFVSGAPDAKERIPAAPFGGAALLRKPFCFAELLGTVSHLVADAESEQPAEWASRDSMSLPPLQGHFTRTCYFTQRAAHPADLKLFERGAPD